MTKNQIIAAMKSEVTREITAKYSVKIGKRMFAVRHVAEIVFGGEHCSPQIRQDLMAAGFGIYTR